MIFIIRYMKKLICIDLKCDDAPSKFLCERLSCCRIYGITVLFSKMKIRVQIKTIIQNAFMAKLGRSMIGNNIASPPIMFLAFLSYAYYTIFSFFVFLDKEKQGGTG